MNITNLSEADAAELLRNFERDMREREPRELRHPMFRLHDCHRCQHGQRACVQGDPSRCEWPMARND